MPPSTNPSTTPAKKPEKPLLVSPDVKGSAVTFRLEAPKAQKVSVAIIGIKGVTPLSRLTTKGDENVWSITFDPLRPDIYEYQFVVDGLTTIDPANMWIKESMRPSHSMFEIVGDPPRIWTIRDDAAWALVTTHTVHVQGQQRADAVPRLHAAGLRRTPQRQIPGALSAATAAAATTTSAG